MEEPRTNLDRARRWPWLVLAAAIAAAGAYGVLRFRSGPDAPATTAEATPADATPAAAPAPPAPPEVETPVGAEGAKALLEQVSANAVFRRWLAGADLIRRCVVVLDNVAEGVSPRKPLRSLAPSAPFTVARRGDRIVIAPDSYARYDLVAEAVHSLDARMLATAYRRLHAVLESAYRALGYPDASLDRVAARALLRIERAPVPDAELEVQDREGSWVFVDPRLERSGDVEKHLLRMGARNERLVQAKAREIREALQLPAPVAAGAR